MGIAIAILAITAATLGWANWPLDPLPQGVMADRILVLKGERRLEVYTGDTLIRSYPVSLGREPVGPKAQEGDGRTPEGAYVIDYLRLDSSYYRALHVSYPRPDQIRQASAQGVSAGGLVMIHGLPNRFGFVGRMHRAADWTVGCIAVTDPEIEELVRIVPVGTPIEIRP